MSTFEAELARELRALPTTAPPSLRERVRALGEPEPRRALPRIPWRGATFVLAPACLAALLAAAVVHGVLSSNRPHPASAGAAPPPARRGGPGGGAPPTAGRRRRR